MSDDDTTRRELDEAVEQEALLIRIEGPAPYDPNEQEATIKRLAQASEKAHEELLDARTVVEAADEFVNLCTIRWGNWRQCDTDAMDKLDRANYRYWEKWGGEKK